MLHKHGHHVVILAAQPVIQDITFKTWVVTMQGGKIQDQLESLILLLDWDAIVVVTDGISLWFAPVAIMSIKVVKDVIRIRAVVTHATITNTFLCVLVMITNGVLMVLVEIMSKKYGKGRVIAPIIVQIVVMDLIATW